MEAYHGKTIVVTAPSGAGKTTIVRHLMDAFPQMAFSVSATTRPIRPGEQDGTDYFFLTRQEFERRVAANEFIEWEEVYPGVFYGSLKSEVERLQNAGKVVVFDIDVKGAANIKEVFGHRCLTVFIKPPSIEVLRQRLLKRGTDTPESIRRRLDKAAFEMSFEDRFDVSLLNDSLDLAVRNAKFIVSSFFNLKIPV